EGYREVIPAKIKEPKLGKTWTCGNLSKKFVA
ncbi:hypothetical protein CCACVL1_24411, partial [Corchorus capsularis]